MKRRAKHHRTDRAEGKKPRSASGGISQSGAPALEPVVVPANLRRSLSASLSLLDRRMCDVQRWANSGQWKSVLYQEHNALTPEQSREILSEVSAIREILAQLREDLALEPKVGFVARSIQAGCTASCLGLAGLDPKQLRRYGEVPAGLANYLEPRLAKLAECLQRIWSIAGAPCRTGPE